MKKNKLKIIIQHFADNDPIIHDAIQRTNFSAWLKPRKTDEYFISLCREIVSQQLAGSAARAIFGRFKELFGNDPITPDKILEIPSQTLRDIGMSWAKAKYIKDLSDRTLQKSLDLSSLNQLDDDSVITELTKVKGIGPWTAEMFLLFTLQRKNIFSHGDLGLKKGLEKLYKISDPTENQINNIIKPWSPYKSYGSIALWQSLET